MIRWNSMPHVKEVSRMVVESLELVRDHQSDVI